MRGRDQIPRGRGSARDGSHRRVVTLETTPSGRAPIDARVDRVPRATSRDAAHTSTFVMSACAQFASTAVAGLRAQKAQKRARAIACRASSQPMWFPGTAAPAHLKGELPGDYGFDPLNLGKEPKDLEWYVQAELQHGRWAMLGVAGAAAPEILTNMGISNLPNWHDAPKYDGYFTDATTLFWVQMLMMNWAEVRRWQDMRKPGSVNEDPAFAGNKLPAGVVGYPGGIFDPLGYAKGDLKTLKAKEIANGRLAMVAFAGIMVQYDHTGVGPVANLLSHMSNPAVNNVFAAKFVGL